MFYGDVLQIQTEVSRQVPLPAVNEVASFHLARYHTLDSEDKIFN